jgi:hypothetical protein
MEYRYALDAVSAECWRKGPPLIVSNMPELEDELEFRRITDRGQSLASIALWLEPVRETLSADLRSISSGLSPSGTVMIVASLPLSRLLPEKRANGQRALGCELTGLNHLRNALTSASFELRESHGIHSITSIGLNITGRLLERIGRSDLADQFAATARERYCSYGRTGRFATLMLISAQKNRRQQ